jgi:hypothetical protein
MTQWRDRREIQDVWVHGMNTEARINRRTGLRLLNADTVPSMPKTVQEYIKNHEEGHFVKATRSELTADRYAFYRTASKNRSLKEIMHALIDVLDERDPEHDLRVQKQWERAKIWDKYINGNNF